MSEHSIDQRLQRIEKLLELLFVVVGVELAELERIEADLEGRTYPITTAVTVTQH